jgi:DNA-binding response OmpR family regulator
MATSLAGMRILILTGQSPDEAAARNSGVNGLILKPFRLHHFLDLVRDQLDNREREDPRVAAVPVGGVPAGAR